MADTRRTLDSFVNASTGLIKDNAAGDISPQDLRDFVVSVYGGAALFWETTAKTANFTAEVGAMHPVDLDTAADDVIVTFPASPSAGDSFGVFVKTEHADTGDTSSFVLAPYFCVEPIDSTSVNGESYTDHDGSDGGGKWSLWLRGECLIFTYDGSTWLVSYDGRIPHRCVLRPTSNQSISDATTTTLTLAEAETDAAGLANLSGDQIDIKRTSSYELSGHIAWGQFASAANRALARIWLNGTSYIGYGEQAGPASSAPDVECYVPSYELDAGDYLELRTYQDSGASEDTLGNTVASGANSSQLGCSELL